MLAVGLVGYLMRLAGFPFLPAVLGVVLGPLVESNYRRSLLLSGGDHAIFLEDPIAIGFLVTAAVFVIWSLVARVPRQRSPTPAQGSHRVNRVTETDTSRAPLAERIGRWAARSTGAAPARRRQVGSAAGSSST